MYVAYRKDQVDRLTFSRNHHTNIDAHRAMYLGDTVRSRWPFCDKNHAALFRDEARVIVGFKSRDVGIVVQVDRSIANSAIENAYMRRESLVFWIVDEGGETLAIVACCDDVWGRHVDEKEV